MSLDFTTPRIVLAGTCVGECSQGGRVGMHNVASVVMNRVDAGWASSVIGVCFAPAQFSCWSDHNRARIEATPQTDPATWALALDIADAALAGTLPNEVGQADSYYASSMRRAPFWAKAPARHVFSDHWHSFWLVGHTRSSAPNASYEQVTIA